MKIKHDPSVDAIYIRLNDKKIALTEPVPANWNEAALDRARDGTLIGVELRRVSQGIDLRNIPGRDELNISLEEAGFQVMEDRPSEVQRLQRFIDVIGKGFMLHDVRAAILGKANFLAALGLVSYTETWGNWLLGGHESSSERSFEAFLPYLGTRYVDLNAKLKGEKRKGLYSFRSALVHGYGLKSLGTIRMGVDREDRSGLEYTEAGWDFCVEQYAKDFSAALNKLSEDIEEKPVLMNSLLDAVGSRLDTFNS